MSKFPKIVLKRPMAAMSVTLGIIVALAAAPALADSPQVAGSASPSAGQLPSPERVKRVGTRMETIVVLGGAVDPDKRRWADSGKATAVLPTVSESAFLEGEGAESVESPTDSRP